MNTHSTRYLTILLLQVWGCLMVAQEKTYTLNSDLSGSNQNYVARDSVSLKPGFSYSASSTTELNLSIDPTLLFMPSGTLNANSDGTASSNGGIVGSINGNFSVTPAGGASYAIPIESPTGANGINPNISITYNSQLGNGVMGWGWNLAGVSSLMRTGSNLYYDEKIRPVTISGSDNLLLDGERLILVSGSNWNNESNYRTEIESYKSITKKGSYFEVKTKDGLTMEYGSTPDAKLLKDIGYMISTITDANGNYIEYKYMRDDEPVSEYSHVRLEEINYGGNRNGTPHPYSIKFSYNERPDMHSVYVHNVRVVTSRLLTYIKIYSNHELLREYEVSYDYDDIQSRLTSIKLSSPESHYNATQIVWGISEYNQRIEYLTPEDLCNLNEKQFCYGDFNGDGRTDFVVYDEGTRRVSLYISENTTNIFRSIASLKMANGTKIEEMMTGDFTGDGYGDLVLINKSRNNFIHELYTFDGSYFSYRTSFTSTKKGMVGDFDGDGKTEILNAETTKVLQFNGSSFTTIAEGGITWGEKAHASFFPNNRYLLDFNGDGKTDVIILRTSGYEIYSLNNASTPTFTSLISGSYPNLSTGIYFGDFNGDGKTDMINQDINSYEMTLRISKGNSFTSQSISTLPGAYPVKFYIGDFNGDGKNDYAYVKDSKLIIGYSNGEKFIEKSNSAPYITEPNAVIVGDFNGDGREDILYNLYYGPCIGGTSMKMGLYTFGKNDEKFFVKNIKDGLGRETQIEYASTNNSDVYECNNYTSSFPVSFFPSALKVVKSYKEGGGTNWFETNMNYFNARLHRQGKGFLGFEEIHKTEIQANKLTKTLISYNNTYFNPEITEQNVSTIDGQAISTTTYTYSRVGLGGKRILPYVSKQVSTNHLTTLTVTTDISDIDDGGNPQTIKTTKGSHTETKTIEYVQKGAWCKNKPSSITTVLAVGSENQTRRVTYEYDDNGNVKQKVVDPTDTQSLITQYTYNDFGNCLQTSVTANGITRNSQKTYDASGLFMTSSTNALGQTTTYNWNSVNGLLESKTDYQERTTYYVYNSFGDLKETIYPDGVKEAQETFWAAPGNSYSGKYYIHKEASGSSPVTIFYDILGRKVRTETYGLNNKIITSTEYNSDGTVYRTSEPRFESGTTVWAATYGYDDFKRPVTVETPKGAIITENNGLTTTVTGPGEEKITTLNSAGQVTETKTNGKKVTFAYYPSNLMKSATPENKDAIQLEYNLQGNRTKITDPDAGTVTTTYNGFGELLTERQKIHLDQNEIQTSYTYAPNGLLQRVTQNGKNTVYSYDTKQRISSIEIAGEHKQVFMYDGMDRVIQLEETLENKTLAQTTEYTQLGQIKKEIYPTGYYTYNLYNQYGYLSEIKDAENRIILKPTAENARRQLTHIKRGNIEAVYGYDDRGYPTSISAGSIINMNFSFDEEGNLRSRSDLLTNQREDFQYDDLNRLVQWDIYQNNIHKLSEGVSYNAAGSIEAVDCEFSYTMDYGNGNNKSNQLTGVDNAIGGVFSTDQLKIDYTDFKKVKKLTLGAAGHKIYNLTYGVDKQRRMSCLYEFDRLTRTKYYLGNYEEEELLSGSTRKTHYLPGGAIYVEDNTSKTLYYGYYDYQNSLVAIANSNGTINSRYAYSPWGERREETNWTQLLTVQPTITDRGYTMHEHLNAFGLINMNGRIYEPITMSFFSPDPYLQAPDNWLNYNRYLYCYGNPLKYTDPDGEWVHILIGGLIGAFMNLDRQMRTGNIKNVGQFFLSFGIGGLAGAAGAWGGSLLNTVGFASGAINGSISGFSSGFINGAGNAWISGSSFGSGLKQGATSGSKGALSGALIGGISSGIKAKQNGGKFWSGKGTTFVNEMIVSDPQKLGGDYFKDNQSMHEYINSKNGWEPGDFGIDDIDVETPIERWNKDETVYRYRDPNDGVLMKADFANGTTNQLGGVRVTSQLSTFSSKSIIYMSPHQTLSGFTATLNHEFIHAYHYSLNYNKLLGSKAYENYTEVSAYNYNLLHGNRQNALDILERFKYNGPLDIFNWPSYLLPIPGSK